MSAVLGDRAAALSRLEGLARSRSIDRSLSLDGPAAKIILGALGVALFLGAWELAVVTATVSERDIPRFSTVIGELWRQAGTSDFWSVVGTTAGSAAIGLGIAMVVGITVGIALGASETAWRALRPTIEFLRAVPSLALMPVAAVIWGPARGSDVFLVAIGCVYPLLLQTIHGVHSVDDVALTTARALRLGRLARIRWVYLPGSLPYIATGLRLAIAFALVIAIGTEIIVGSPGIGTAIRQAQSSLDLPRMYAYVLASGLIGMVVVLLTGLLERRLLRWHPSMRGDKR